MNTYGDLIIVKPPDIDVVNHARKIAFRQAYETWVELGSPPIISFKLFDSPGDLGCMFLLQDGFAPHDEEPHQHVGWKMTLDNG